MLVGEGEGRGHAFVGHVHDHARGRVLEIVAVVHPQPGIVRVEGDPPHLAGTDVDRVEPQRLRDLWRRDQDRGLSAGEKRMLAKARQILISELALAEKTDEEKASTVLDEVLAS